MTPLVSVIIPTYNRCDLLKDAVESVLKQTFEGFELIIVDDGSTDATSSMLAAYVGDSRVRYVHQEHAGTSAGAARNKGLAAATGRYLAFLDSDDLWLPEKIERQVAAMQANPGIGVVYCAYFAQEVDSKRSVISEIVVRRPPQQHRTLYEDLLYRNVISGSASSVLIRAECFSRAGPFKEHLPASDIDMWRRLALQEEFLYLNEPLVRIRRHASNMSNSSEFMLYCAAMDLEIMKSEIPPRFRHHLPAIEAQHYTLGFLTAVVHGRPRLGGEFMGRLFLLSVLHPVAMIGAVRCLYKRRQLNRKQAKSTLARPRLGG